MWDKFRRKTIFRGQVQFGYDADTSSRDITLYGHTTAATMLWDASADQLIFAASSIKVTPPTDVLAADLVGYTNLGYTTTEPASSTIAGGAVRVFKDTTNWYLAVHTTSAGTWKFMAFDLTTGGLS